MQQDRIILEGRKFQLTIERLCQQLIENHERFENCCVIGIQERGVAFADRLYARLKEISGIDTIPYGKLDVTFYRDDFRMRAMPLTASRTEMDFLVDGKTVILVDDVLYTGRTVRAALDALQHYGRPNSVELVVLVDRRFNRHLPISPDYTGILVDALDEAYVRVNWAVEPADIDKVIFYPKK